MPLPSNNASFTADSTRFPSLIRSRYHFLRPADPAQPSLSREGNEEIGSSGAGDYTIGLIADTHIPDRVESLHPDLIPLLRASGVSHILHAGDISVSRALDELRAAAPVTAVRGNRDLLARALPMSATLEAGPVRVRLVHGHFGLIPYLWEKVHFFRTGYDLSHYLPRLMREAQDANVVVFGHTHFPEIIHQEGKLLVNPGSASFGPRRGLKPTFGLLMIRASGDISVDILPLEGWKIERRKWVRA